jgi:hypothetical protein
LLQQMEVIRFKKPLLGSFFYRHLSPHEEYASKITHFKHNIINCFIWENTSLMLAKRYFVVKGKRRKVRDKMCL